MVKIETFDATTFWNKSYAHQRGKLLKRVQVPDDQIKILVKKDGQFSGTCASNSPLLNKEGESCSICGALPDEKCQKPA